MTKATAAPDPHAELGERLSQLTLPQQITIGVRLGLNMNRLSYGDRSGRSEAILAAVEAEGGWEQLELLVQRAEEGWL